MMLWVNGLKISQKTGCGFIEDGTKISMCDYSLFFSTNHRSFRIFSEKHEDRLKTIGERTGSIDGITISLMAALVSKSTNLP